MNDMADNRNDTNGDLARFTDQKTVLLTTYRRDGTPVGTPVNIAVDGARAFIRSYERSGKAKRLRNNPLVEIAPSTTRGSPTGPAIHARARKLTDDESKHAAHLLQRKHPLLQGIMVPLTHHLFRRRYGRTVHYEVTLPGRTGASQETGAGQGTGAG